VYLYDDAKEVGEEMYMMGIYYAVDRAETAGTVEGGSDAIDARFWTPAEFEASDQTLKDMPNPDEIRSWKMGGLDVLRDLATEALQRESTYSETFAPHLDS
jgi:hypothetical protein